MKTATIDSNANRIRDYFALNDNSSVINDTKLRATDVNSNETNNNASTRSNSGKKVSFNSVLKHNPLSIGTVGLRRSWRIANVKKKLLDSTLNHVGFAHANEPSEEGIDLMKETFSFKEAMKSSCRKEFIEAMKKKASSHAKCKHWAHYCKDEVPVSETLQSTWTFKIKRD